MERQEINRCWEVIHLENAAPMVSVIVSIPEIRHFVLTIRFRINQSKGIQITVWVQIGSSLSYQTSDWKLRHEINSLHKSYSWGMINWFAVQCAVNMLSWMNRWNASYSPHSLWIDLSVALPGGLYAGVIHLGLNLNSRRISTVFFTSMSG